MVTKHLLPSFQKELLSHVIDKRAKEDPDALFAEYPVSTTGYEKGFRKITYSTLANLINGLAWWLHKTLGSGKNFETLAYMGPSDIRYNALILGAVKAGYKLLLISPRNSIPAQKNLFNLLECRWLVTPQRDSPIVSSIVASHEIEVLEVPTVEELFYSTYPVYEYKKTFQDDRQDPLVVLHTSGTTNLPKPILWTHDFASSLAQWEDLVPPPGYRRAFDIYSTGKLFCSFPPFHCGGLILTLLNPIYKGHSVVFPPVGAIPSAQTLADCLRQTEANCAAIPPLVLEQMYKKVELLEFISARLPAIVYGGGNAAPPILEKLAKKIKLVSILGSTETGVIPTIYCCDHWPVDEWSYFRFDPAAMIDLQRVSDNEYEAVVQRNPVFENEQPPFKIFPESSEYRTGDLYTPHATKPDLWLYCGRSDDIIVFLTGEKTNPTSMERAIAKHPEVSAVLVAGTLRFQAALLIELATDQKRSTSQRAEVIERLWPTIQQANGQCPRHAQITKSHILFTDPDKPMLRTGKGTVQRKLTLRLYESEIDRLYADAAKVSESDASHDPISGRIVELNDGNAVSSFISKVVAELMNLPSANREENLFLSGMDSLQALRLTQKLKAKLALPDFDIITAYTNPTISSLTNKILRISTENETSRQSKQSSRTETIEKLIEKYKTQAEEIAGGQSTDTDLTNSSKAMRNSPEDDSIVTPKGNVILLTGSTGAIGCYLMEVLLARSDVSHVYCLNRTTDSRSLQIQRSQERGLPVDFTSDRVTFLTADLSKPRLGLEQQTHEDLRRNITHIIHNAWPVNFNLSLPAFFPHLDGVVNLVRLAATATHCTSFHFISSISSVLSNATNISVAEKIFTEPLSPLPMAYAESKYIAERILADASRIVRKLCSVTVTRVGQVAGAADSGGIWNKREWIPSLVTSSLYLGAVPASLGNEGDRSDFLDWVPIDILAHALVDFSLIDNNPQHPTTTTTTNGSNPPRLRVFHPVSPRPTSWRASFLPIVTAVAGPSRTISVVPLASWVSRLRASAAQLDTVTAVEATLAANPAVKLLGFFEGLVRGDGGHEAEAEAGEAARAGTGMATGRVVDGRQAWAASERLRGLEGLHAEWVQRWVRDWVR